MKRVLILTLLSFVLIFGAMAAGGEESSEANQEPIVMLRSHGTNAYAMESQPDDIYFKKMTELSGDDVIFEFIDHANQGQVLTLRFASGNLLDAAITSITNPNLGDALENSIFQDITDYIEEFDPNTKKKLPEAFWESPHLSSEGRIYALPWMGPLPDTRVVYMRKDWLDRLGVDVPKTVEDYFEPFELIKAKDVDGDGDTDDEVAFGLRERLNYSEFFFGSYELNPDNYNLVDGKLIPDVVNPKMKEVVRLWREM
jgi:putative aldouronate transport system substrate-binding protein